MRLSRFQNFTGRVGPGFLRSGSGITGRVKISISINFSNRQFGIINVYLRFDILNTGFTKLTRTFN
jgi:hypothetical protein